MLLTFHRWELREGHTSKDTNLYTVPIPHVVFGQGEDAAHDIHDHSGIGVSLCILFRV